MPRPVTTEAELLDRALALLSRRAHSRSELLNKLRRYQPSDEQLGAVLARLEQAGWLDDARFARDLADSMVRRGRTGPARIRASLRGHGVPAEQTAAAMADTAAEVSADDWLDSCRAVARDRVRRGLSLQDPRDRARLQRFLLGRGFTHAMISPVIRELGAQLDDDAELQPD